MESKGRRYGMLAVLALLPFLLPGCGGGDGNVLTLRFWNGFTGPDGRTMLALVKRFNEENPDVRVLMQRMDWASYYNKLFVAGMGGRAPQVFVIHADNIPRFMRADFVRPVDDLVAADATFDAEDILPVAWAAVGMDGRHYGIPLDVHPQGLYYNATLFREAGMVDDAGNPVPPRDRASFLAALEKLTRDLDGDGRPDQWGFVFTWLRTNMLTLMNQWGGTFFNEDLSACTVNCPANVETLTFCRNLIERDLVPSPENIDSWVGFRQGKVAMVFEGIYMLADLQKQSDLDYGAAPVPVLGKRPATWASSHTLCLANGLDPKVEAAAWRFVRFLSGHALDWAEGGQIPARNSLRNTERFREMAAQSAFAKQLDYVVYAPRVPFIFEFFTEFDAAVESALRGSATPKEALDNAARRTNATIARYREMTAEGGGDE